MPIFEYRCPNCESVTEKLLRTAEDRDKHEAKCPRCHAKMDSVPYSKVSPFRWGKGGSWNG